MKNIELAGDSNPSKLEIAYGICGKILQMKKIQIPMIHTMISSIRTLDFLTLRNNVPVSENTTNNQR